jgi:hypothetical protein
MLFNVSSSATVTPDPITVPATEALHESILVPTDSVIKAGFLPSHYNGIFVNVSGLDDEPVGAYAYLFAVSVGAAAPTRAEVLAGIPLAPAGSEFEIPPNSDIDFYFAAKSAVTVKGLYFGRPGPLN